MRRPSLTRSWIVPRRKVVSQREARRLLTRVRELENRQEALLRGWGSEYPGTHIDTLTVTDVEAAIIRTAWGLKHPVVLRPSGRDREFYVYAAWRR